jgi:hypothetical protein
MSDYEKMFNILAKFKNSLNIDPSGSGKPRIDAHTADFEQFQRPLTE